MTEAQNPGAKPPEDIPEKIPASKEPTEPILEKAFKKEPRHAEEESPED